MNNNNNTNNGTTQIIGALIRTGLVCIAIAAYRHGDMDKAYFYLLLSIALGV